MDYQIGDRLARWSDLLNSWQVGTIKAQYIGEFAVTDVKLLASPGSPNKFGDEPNVINLGKAIWPIGQVFKI